MCNGGGCGCGCGGGGGNLPTAHYMTARYDAASGAEVAGDGPSPLTVPTRYFGDFLTMSRSGKDSGQLADRGTETRPLETPAVAAAFAATGIKPDALSYTIGRPKVAAKGYVDPAMVALRRGIFGTDLITDTLELKP